MFTRETIIFYDYDIRNDLKSLEELEPPRAFQKYEDQHYDVFDIKDVNAPVDESIDSPSVDFLRLAKEAEHLKYPWEEMESIVEDGGVRKRVLRPGQFSNLPTKLNQVKDGHRVWIHYNTYIDERTRLTLLDSTVGHRLATTLRVGEDGLPGLYHAVRSMIRNEISEFCFEPEYGYGRFGVPSFIGGNQRLRIILELMDIGKHSRKSAVFMNELEKLSANLSLREVLDDVEKLKEAGNAKVERELYRDACDRYNWAIDLLKNYRNGEESQLTPEDETIDKKMFQLYSNLALCFIRLEDFEEVENMCENALNLVHEDMDLKPKVLYRYATACYRLQRYDLSMKLCERGIQNCIWGHAQFRSLLYNVSLFLFYADANINFL